MIITVNGQPKEIADALTLQELIANVCKNPDRVIAEVNENIIKSPHWEHTALRNNDKIELVTFVGGG